MLFVGYGETGGYPIFGVSIGSLTTFIAICLSAGLGVLLRTLMLITITKRKYLANDYLVVKEQSCFRHTKENRVEDFVLSPCRQWEPINFPSY